jgi:hypothetical protein
LQPEDVRAFLYHELECGPRFNGLGVTNAYWCPKLATGKAGVNARAIRNCKLESLDAVKVTALGAPAIDEFMEYICNSFESLQKAVENGQAPKIVSVERSGGLYKATSAATALHRGRSAHGIEVQLTPGQYIDRLRHGQKLAPNEKLAGICGRLIRGKKANDFCELGKGPTLFLMGPDGLQDLLTKVEAPLDMLLMIGYPCKFIYECVKEGCNFELVVFPDESATGGLTQPATWAGVLRLIELSDPAVYAVVHGHWSTLQARSFHELQTEYVHSMYENMRGGDHHMSREKLLGLGSSARPADVRAYLYHMHALNDLYEGDGYTRDPSGNVGTTEYLVPNKPRADFNGLASCTIGAPTLQICREHVCKDFENLCKERGMFHG